MRRFAKHAKKRCTTKALWLTASATAAGAAALTAAALALDALSDWYAKSRVRKGKLRPELGKGGRAFARGE